jgi:hypothetical protein
MKIQTAILMLGLATRAGVASGQVALTVHHPLPSDTTADNVTVQNDRKVPVTVYLENGLFDRRLGIVPPHVSATLPLPAWLVNGRETVQLFAHPEGEGEDLATQDVSLRPPGRVVFLVPARGGMPGRARTDTMSAVIPPEELADATLTVDNPRTVPVTVFVEQGEFDIRLGQVPAKGSATLRFPGSALLNDSIQLFVHPENGVDLGSQTLRVRKGEHLGLRVPQR